MSDLHGALHGEASAATVAESGTPMRRAKRAAASHISAAIAAELAAHHSPTAKRRAGGAGGHGGGGNTTMLFDATDDTGTPQSAMFSPSPFHDASGRGFASRVIDTPAPGGGFQFHPRSPRGADGAPTPAIWPAQYGSNHGHNHTHAHMSTRNPTHMNGYNNHNQMGYNQGHMGSGYNHGSNGGGVSGYNTHRGLSGGGAWDGASAAQGSLIPASATGPTSQAQLLPSWLPLQEAAAGASGGGASSLSAPQLTAARGATPPSALHAGSGGGGYHASSSQVPYTSNHHHHNTHNTHDQARYSSPQMHPHHANHLTHMTTNNGIHGYGVANGSGPTGNQENGYDSMDPQAMVDFLSSLKNTETWKQQVEEARIQVRAELARVGHHAQHHSSSNATHHGVNGAGMGGSIMSAGAMIGGPVGQHQEGHNHHGGHNHHNHHNSHLGNGAHSGNGTPTGRTPSPALSSYAAGAPQAAAGPGPSWHAAAAAAAASPAMGGVNGGGGGGGGLGAWQSPAHLSLDRLPSFGDPLRANSVPLGMDQTLLESPLMQTISPGTFVASFEESPTPHRAQFGTGARGGGTGGAAGTHKPSNLGAPAQPPPAPVAIASADDDDVPQFGFCSDQLLGYSYAQLLKDNPDIQEGLTGDAQRQ